MSRKDIPPGPGRPKGGKNKKTIYLDRVYQRCVAAGIHPADILIEIAFDSTAEKDLRVKCCDTLLKYIEGQQPEAKPIVPRTPEESVEAAKAIDIQLDELSKPLEFQNKGIVVRKEDAAI